MPLLSVAGFYVLIGLVVWVITLSNPQVRKVWVFAARNQDDLSALAVFVACLIWPIRLLYFLKSFILTAYDNFVIARKTRKGNRMCQAYLDSLREEELEAAGDPERLKYLARQRQIMQKVEAVMKGLCPDCNNELDFVKIDDAAHCPNCKKSFTRNYDPRNE